MYRCVMALLTGECSCNSGIRHVLWLTAVLFLGTTLGVAAGSPSSGVPADAADVCPIKVGETVPALTLVDIDDKPFDLNAAIAAKPTVLIFYRGGWCPYCNTHLGELQTIEAALGELGYQILAISPDLPKNLKSSVQKNELDYRLISDSQAAAARALGLAFQVDGETYERYLGYGIDLEKASGEKHHILPVPAALVVGTDGVVKFAFASPSYKVRVNTQVLLTAAKTAVE